jgi:type IV pilus assembly protein PilE
MHHAPRSASLQRGFTLIELMIVVAVAAVLALIAVPSYMDSVRKSRRADAMAGLMRWQQLQERFRGNQPAYAATLASLQTGLSLQTALSSDSQERHYTLSIDAADPGGYTMSATAKSGSPQFADTKCRKLTVTMANGAITTTSFDASNADTTATARCWVK